MDSKICNNCKKELTIDNFHKNKRGKFGVSAECKECHNKRNKKRNIPINTDVSIKQACTGCGEEFPATLEYFHRFKGGKFGVRSDCRECVNKRQKEKNNPINTDASIKQTCTDCGKKLPATTEFFHRFKMGKFGVRTECRECYNKRNNPPNEDSNIKQTCTGDCSKEKPATLEFFYRDKKGKYGILGECRECCNKKVKQWKKDNRDKVREYRKKRYQNDEQFRIRHLLSTGLWTALNKIGHSKNASILNYIGCDIAFLQQHLNNTKDDSWGDVELHIDHIIPQSLYDHTNEEEIKKCWNWRNLRYFPGADNISKGDILDTTLIKQYGIDDLLPDF